MRLFDRFQNFNVVSKEALPGILGLERGGERAQEQTVDSVQRGNLLFFLGKKKKKSHWCLSVAQLIRTQVMSGCIKSYFHLLCFDSLLVA